MKLLDSIRDLGGRNVLVLAACEALVRGSTNVLITESGLVGLALAQNKSFATVPIAVQYLATLVATFPASLLMSRFGRRAGFSLGALIGITGAVLATTAIIWKNLPLFCMGTYLVGTYNGFASFYRFAAADAAKETHKSRAIGVVLSGGLAAAFIGPFIARHTTDLLPNALYAGSYVVLAGLSLTAGLLLQLTNIPQPRVEVAQAPKRSLGAIAKQPLFIIAAFGGMVGYAAMVFVMTGTPLAMAACHHSFGTTTVVMQAHVVAMFAPSYFTGSLLRRFGSLRIMALGAFFILACSAVALNGLSTAQFWVALVLLGLGWNFLYVASTNLLTKTYTPSEKGRAQGMNDFFVFGGVSLAAFGSGVVSHMGGWRAVNLMVVPPVLLIALILGRLLLKGEELGLELKPAPSARS